MPSITNFPNGFAYGLSLRGIPLFQSNPGQVFWVSNNPYVLPDTVGGADGNPGTFNKPFATLQRALDLARNGTGDVIMVKPGHVETLSNATTLALTKAGVAIIGLGNGPSRPQFVLDTANTSNIALRAAGVAIQNCVFRANFLAIASLITAATFSVTASIAPVAGVGGAVMTVTVVGSGTIYPGMNVMGAGIRPGTIIVQQLSGTTGGVGTYQVSLSQTFGSGTITGGTWDFALENCEFIDSSSVLNFVALVTGNATANSMDGFRFVGNKVLSLGTTATTTALKIASNTDRMAINDNVGVSAVLNDTAAMLAGGAAQFTGLQILRNSWERPSTSTTGGGIISGTGNAWTGMIADNRFTLANAGGGIWISTGHGTALGFNENYCLTTAAADRSGILNPVGA